MEERSLEMTERAINIKIVIAIHVAAGIFQVYTDVVACLRVFVLNSSAGETIAFLGACSITRRTLSSVDGVWPGRYHSHQ